MRIRTSNDLIDKIAEQLVWRRKELWELRQMVEASSLNHSRRATLIRAGVALLYAHWEGFIKTTGTYFLEFVSEQRLKNNELKMNFVSVILRKRLIAAGESKKASSSEELVEFFCTKMNSQSNLPTKGVVDTESNLSSKVLKEILWTLGLEEGPYSTKKTILDERLLDRRNHIAHGEALDIGVEEYLELHDAVVALLEEFRTQVENACLNKLYLRSTAA
jgi:hypothetical protein